MIGLKKLSPCSKPIRGQTKTIVTWSSASSRALGSLHIFTVAVVITLVLVLGQSIEKRSKMTENN